MLKEAFMYYNNIYVCLFASDCMFNEHSIKNEDAIVVCECACMFVCVGLINVYVDVEMENQKQESQVEEMQINERD